MLNLKTRSGAVAFVLMALAGAANADVVVTNLAEPFRATTEVGNNPNPVMPPSGAPLWSWAAQSFITDGASYALTQIDIIGGEASLAPAPVIVAELRADNAGTIGALITTLVIPDMTGPVAPRGLTPSVPVTLDPSTTYWIVLGSQAPGDGTLGWSYANSNESVGTGVIAQYADSQDSGATWNYGTEFPYFIQVVAEPSTACTPCPGDANGDLVVNFDDITEVLARWLNSCAPAR
ncbi:MAG TPA: hypothetical protein DEB06_04195 [Phycisphaerales bacterium]|nr:hypothetical protein [Phycisphaerales bacterium]